MATIFNDIHDFLSNAKDRRLEHLPLIENPWAFIGLVSAYLIFVWNGKRFMEHRNIFQIKRIIIVYNIIQIIANSILFALVAEHVLSPEYSFVCESTDFSNTARGLRLAHIGYAYLILKLFDFFDTIFFILRKKEGHVSYLHVYHHTLVTIGTYLGVLFQPGGQGILLGLLNTFVHAVMYSYYLISIWKPEIKDSKLIKRNITRMQMIQFTILILHFGHVFIIPGNDCGYPKVLSFFTMTQNLYMLILFWNFYQKTYGEKKVQKTQ